VSARQRYLDLLARILPAGAVGATLLLGAAMPAQARDEPQAAQLNAAAERVSDRLAAIRDAVSTLIAQNAAGDVNGNPRLVQFVNVGVPYPWNNWHNWRNYAAPYVAPWGNGWGNGGWHNWRNWRNW
jgi:rSAM-associated Gly-rich repeat protein